MNKNEYLFELRKGLAGLPAEDIKKSVAYYREMIDDRIEDGMSESMAVASMCHPGEAVRQILADTSFSKLIKVKMNSNRRAWVIALLIIGFPVWFPLLAAFFSVVISISAALLSVVVSVGASALGCFVGGIGGVVVSIFNFNFGTASDGLLMLGMSIACIGVSLILAYFFAVAVKGSLYLIKLMLRGIKICIIGRG